MTIGGREVSFFNGGSSEQHSNAISMMILTEDQEQTDRYGVRWQVTPRQMMEILSDPDQSARERAFTAMLTMGKLEINQIETAFAGD